jgi:hypothetical protein
MRTPIARCGLLALLASTACITAGAASSPEALALGLQKAMQAGDLKAAAALADIERAPAELRFFYYAQVLECSVEATCTTSLAPIDAEYRANLQEQAKEAGAEPLDAAGLVVVTTKSLDGSGSGTMKMPYAKYGNDFKLATMRVSDAEFAARRAKSNETLLQEMFAQGIYDSAKGERRTDWATAATRLPADGGDAGKAFVRQTAAMAAAVDAKDPDAAMRSGGQWAAMVFGDKSYDGKPIPAEQRKRKLQVQSLRMLRDVKVSGGYRFGDDVALMFEARNGIGWIERGAVVLTRDGEEWDVAGKRTVSYP